MPHLRVPPRVRTRIPALIAACAAGLLVVMGAPPAAADPQDEKVRVDRELASTRAAMEAASESVDAAATAYHDATKRLPQVQARLAAARSDLAAAKAASRTATRTATAAANELRQADREVTQALRRVEDTRVQIEEYAVNAFMGRDIAGADALLSMSSPADFVAGYGYLELVAEDQRAAMAAFQGARADAAERQSAQTEKAEAADEARGAADAALRKAASAEAAAAAAERDVASLVAQRAGSGEGRRSAPGRDDGPLQGTAGGECSDRGGDSGAGPGRRAGRYLLGRTCPCPWTAGRPVTTACALTPSIAYGSCTPESTLRRPVVPRSGSWPRARSSGPAGTVGTATTPASITACTRGRASRPVMPTSRRSWSN